MKPAGLQRRHLLAAGSATLALPAQALDFAAPRAPAAMRASIDRIVDITVGIRPFRAQGPRIEAERRFGKTLVHHYGHGGSGWSLCWGSAQRALALVQVAGLRPGARIAVVGCGAIGLTTARTAQQAGYKVRLYAKDRPPRVHSSAATGLWTPDSRIVTSEHASEAWTAGWEAMARASFKVHQSYLGLPSGPVEWHDGFVVADEDFDQPIAGHVGEPDYPDLHPRVADLRPRGKALAAGEHPFRLAHVRRFTQLVFNIPAYQRLLLDDFARDGGELVQREFRQLRDLGTLPERLVVNCTGDGARMLLGDTSLTPVRGQTARLIPQPEVDYALIYRGRNVVALPRRDGLLIAAMGEHDFGSDDLRPDRAHSEDAVRRLAALF
ncbi:MULTISPECIES: FAD-dependent oxidoreductase [unclassified Roseateles]|uniref:FAD-dependent oxidoreductase n=1 Tax=unclassified Roseateles TaxID=2626991 RepID=UPI0006FAC625|nr:MULTISPECIES: FAD-dependent oxidoreductase [unclassified Roseateles]KQW42870.1 D-amino acid oxidase [Pelomonas sp. Root405]KRA69548.1 D-amino acid oxidase [Pelomonas sp. Root662]